MCRWTGRDLPELSQLVEMDPLSGENWRRKMRRALVIGRVEQEQKH